MSKGKQPRTRIKGSKIIVKWNKGSFFRIQPGNRLRSGHFLKTS